MFDNESLRLLKESKIFRGLSDEQINMLFDYSQLSRFDSQDVIIEEMIKSGPAVVENDRIITEKAFQKMMDAGMEVLTLPPDEAKKYLDIAYGVTWEDVLTKAPEYGPRFKKLLLK